jgi:hypothetical protein
MLRKILFTTAAALSVFSATNSQASDRFSLGLNLGGGYPVYQPAPVVVNPYPATVYAPSYPYSNYGYSGYGSGYGYGSTYVNPGVSFGYSNYNYRPQYRPLPSNGWNNGGWNNGGWNGGYGHNHGCR